MKGCWVDIEVPSTVHVVHWSANDKYINVVFGLVLVGVMCCCAAS